jgi:phage portal protein BeeE
VTNALDKARKQAEWLQGKARTAIARRAESSRQGGMVGGYSPGPESVDTPFGVYSTSQDNLANAQRQYQAYKGTAYTAINPLARRAANLPIRCGFAGPGSGAKFCDGDMQNKAMIDGWLDRNGYVEETNAIEHTKALRCAPEFIKKDLNNSKIKPLEDHFLLKLLSNPNEHYRGSALKNLSYASMMLTGRFVWWFDTSGNTRQDAPELGNLRVWYLPRHWLRPDPLREWQWEIQCPGMTGSIKVNAGELFLSTIPDPENPFRPHSPLQSQAASVDSEDKMLKAQAVTLDNVIRPSLILIAGRLPGMPGVPTGKGPKHIFSPDQREQLISAINMTHAGWRKYGHPMILDGLIEDAKPFMAGPNELDFGESVSLSGDRIMEGMGVSRIIAGKTDNANRAGSQIAKEVFNENTLNPLVTFVSEDMDSVLGPRFSLGTRRLHIWQDQSQANDPEMLLQRIEAVKEHFSAEELREWAATGELNLKAAVDAESKKITSAVVNAPGTIAAVTGNSNGNLAQ